MSKKIFFRVTRGVLGAGLIISYIAAVVSVASMQIIPLPYVIVATIITLIIVIVLCIALFKKEVSKGRGIAASIIALLMIIANIYAFTASNATNSFLNSFSEDEYSEIEYSIVAKETNDVTLAPSSTQKMGLLATDEHTDLVKPEIEKRTGAEYKDAPEITSLTQALDTGEATAATLQSSYLPLLEENYETFYADMEVLATFTIRVKNDTDTTTRDVSQPFVMYISGIDTDGDIASVSRSDVNILAVVNPQTKKILLVNTPRDYYVQLHGTTGERDKLTHAGIYGVDMSKKTLEDVYDTPIDYYMRVNFASLTKLIDAIGGVDVYSEYDFASQSYEFTKGYNYVDGKQALDFARTRKAFTEGDRVRGQNQQRVIEAIVHKLSSPETLVNYQSILGALEGTFQTNADKGDITALAQQQLNSLGRWDVTSISVDGTGATAPTYSMGALPLYVMEPNEASVQAAQQAIRELLSEV